MALEAEEYHYVDDVTNESKGPLSLDECKQLWLQGVLKRDTLIFGAPDQEAWQAISELPALLRALAPATPAPPVPSRGGSIARKPSFGAAPSPAPAESRPKPAPGGFLAEIQGGAKGRLKKAETKDKSKPRTGGGGVVEGGTQSRSRTASVSATGGKAGVTSPSGGGGMAIGGGGLNSELAAKLAKRRQRLQTSASSTSAAGASPAARDSLPPAAKDASAAVEVVHRPAYKAPSPGKIDSGIPAAAAAAAAGTKPATPAEITPAAAPVPPTRGPSAKSGGGHARRSSDDMAVGKHSADFEGLAEEVVRPGGGAAPAAPPRRGSSGATRGQAAGEAPPPLAPKPKARRASAFAGSSSKAADMIAAANAAAKGAGSGRATPSPGTGAAAGAGAATGGKKKRLGGAAQSISVGAAGSAAPFGISDVSPSAGAGSSAAPTHSSPDAAWVVRGTADGKEYYHNTSSGELTWDKPRCLQTEEERAVSQAEWTWVPHPQRAWLPAKIKSKSGTKVSVVTKDGIKQTVSSKEVPMWPLHLPSLKRIAEVQDLVQLRQLNEATIITCLAERFAADNIYTWVGASKSVLVSLNPFKSLPIYTPKTIAEHATPPPNKLLAPHVFDIAAGAWKSLIADGKSQSILISGESGAGKTEAAKQCLAFLAETVGSVGRVEQKLLQSNPVLEAFGNAKTVRNNNSSRFGKWIEYYMNPMEGGQIVGAQIENYLLEKSRIALQGVGERSYHIFYQLTSSQYGVQLGLGGPTAYRSLLGGASIDGRSGDGEPLPPQEIVTVGGVDDAADFDEVFEAFEALGFDMDAEVGTAMQLLSGILHAGNVAFAKDGEGSKVAPQSNADLQAAAAAFGVTAPALADAWVHHTIDAPGRPKVLHNVAESQDARDALSKAVYGRMFDWLVTRINKAVAVQKAGAQAVTAKDFPFIGVLDIFGFEIFEFNSFEQLCINYCNEKLQQLFNKHTFKEEIAVYEDEGIEVPPVRFIDNKPVLDLIEQKARAGRPGGVLVLLDDEIRLPETSDETFVKKVMTSHGSHPALSLDTRSGFKSGVGFTIQHYAGSVDYDARDFLTKNKDVLWMDLTDLMLSSSTEFIPKQLFAKEAEAAASSVKGRSKYSMGGQFRTQLSKLVSILNNTAPRYIRCVKTTPHKRPNDLHPTMCIEQLRYSGVFEAVQIRKTGFPFRMTHQQFVARYAYVNEETRAVARGSHSNPNTDWPAVVTGILNKCKQNLSAVQIGKTMVLYRAPEHNLLELMRNLALEPISIRAQQGIRGCLARRFVCRYRAHLPALRAAIATGNDLDAIEAALAAADKGVGPRLMRLMGGDPPLLASARLLASKLRQCRALEGELSELLRRSDAEKETVEYARELAGAVKTVQGVLDVPHTKRLDELAEQATAFLSSIASRLVDPEAREALYLLDAPAMRRISAKAADYAYESDDIGEIRAVLALPEAELVKLQHKRAKELGDNDRRINREIKLQDIYLQNNARFFALETFPQLRPVHEFGGSTLMAKFSSSRREKLEQSMLVFSADPIPISLTELEKPLAKEAQRLHRSILAWCGDHKGSASVASVASEFVRDTHNTPALRSEALLQIMKHINQNPNPHSADSAWTLLFMCLRCYQVPEPAEGHVIVFIRKHAGQWAQTLMTALHNSKYDASLRATPPVPAAIDGFVREFGDGLQRSRFSVSDDVIATHSSAAHVSPVSAMPQDMTIRESDHATAVGGAAADEVHIPAAGAGHGRRQSVGRSADRPVSSKYASPAAAAPPAPPRRSGAAAPAVVAVAQFDFNKTPEDAADTLDLATGQTMDVLDESDPDWWMVRQHDTGVQGFVPAAYLAKR